MGILYKSLIEKWAFSIKGGVYHCHTIGRSEDFNQKSLIKSTRALCLKYRNIGIGRVLLQNIKEPKCNAKFQISKKHGQ